VQRCKKSQKIVEASSLWFSCDLEILPPRAYLNWFCVPTILDDQSKRNFVKTCSPLSVPLGEHPEPLKRCVRLVIQLPDILPRDSSRNPLITAKVIHDYFLLVRSTYNKKWNTILHWEGYVSLFRFQFQLLLLLAGIFSTIVFFVSVFLLRNLPLSARNANKEMNFSEKFGFVLIFITLGLYTVIAAYGCFQNTMKEIFESLEIKVKAEFSWGFIAYGVGFVLCLLSMIVSFLLTYWKYNSVTLFQYTISWCTTTIPGWTSFFLILGIYGL
jgi:hypothetical protein